MGGNNESGLYLLIIFLSLFYKLGRYLISSRCQGKYYSEAENN